MESLIKQIKSLKRDINLQILLNNKSDISILNRKLVILSERLDNHNKNGDILYV